MKNTTPEVDAYIERAANFAKPILKRLRKLFHQADSRIHEEIKWGVPHFLCLGMVGMMAAFKQHVSWGFWNAKKLPDLHGLLKSAEAPTSFGFKPRSAAELPPDDVILDYIRAAVALNEQGVKRDAPKKNPAKVKIPKDLKAALKQNPIALATFEGFPPSHKREYIEWITEAKREATRQQRLATTIEWLSQGKPRNWKYMNCGKSK